MASAKKEKDDKEKAPRESAASMFKELIMTGGMTDDQIFAKVKAKYDLDDKKRGYVGWYRNWLKKQGQNPPDPKPGKPVSAKDPKPARTKKGPKTEAAPTV